MKQYAKKSSQQLVCLLVIIIVENSRNKNSGLYKPVYTNTPIRQGEMKWCLTHIIDDINVIMLITVLLLLDVEL